ncbi:MAG: ATP-dependent helicase HrpA [Phycisphaerae bacterium]|nr:MAG: ATP-dependent helicase HrpA [Phycisphaerae bacterium]
MDSTLPILLRRAEIEAALRSHQVLVLCGATGSGKTTQLPQIAHAMGLGARGRIACTQPRRIAARAVASRIADEMGARLGGLVGYKVRFDERTGRDTAIKVLTDGMLLAELEHDRDLAEYATIIIDEAHERSLNIDFLLGYLRTLLPRRPDLKLIITSATIDPARFSTYFGGSSEAPVIEVSGRLFPVEVRYHADQDDALDADPADLDLDLVADAVEELTARRVPPGEPADILVFLPGEREIRLAEQALRRRGVDADLLPLYARLSTADQDRIFRVGQRRRAILATNIAETSLTVPGIRYVVDTGLARIARYDPQRKVAGLPIEPISRASAEQRAGRCGRLASGVCIRLYSRASFEQRPAFTAPEIQRANLAAVILRMKSLELGRIEEFPFLDPPDPASIRDGHETLFELGAVPSIDPDAPLTPIGVQLARLPLDPRIGRMLLAASREGALAEVIILAAALSIQDPRQRPAGQHDAADRAQLVFRHDTSDFLTLLRLFDQYQSATETLGQGALHAWCREHYLSAARMREWDDMARQLAATARELGLTLNTTPASEGAVHRALLPGLISNVACRDAAGGSFDYKGVRGNTLALFPGSVLFKKGPKWIMAAEVVHTSRLYARTVARIEPEWIEELAGHMFRHQLSDRHFDAETGQPSAWERVTINGVVVVPRRRTPLAPHDPAAARRIFIEQGLAQGLWSTDLPFAEHNRRMRASAKAAEAKLRRRGLAIGDEAVAAWFDARVPPHVHDPRTLLDWYTSASAAEPGLLRLAPADVLLPDAANAAGLALFPDVIELRHAGRTIRAPLAYAWNPGKDDDGLTVSLDVADLPALSPERAAWLVPGLLEPLILAILKTLPRGHQAALTAKAPLADIAAACASLLDFGKGTLPAALREAIAVLHGVELDPAAIVLQGLPSHLRLRVRVMDADRELAADRDLAALHARFAPRVAKAAAARARAAYERDNLTEWSFGDLPESVTVEHNTQPVTAYPTLIDEGGSVGLTLVYDPHAASAHLPRGVRRLFALAIRDEASHHLAAFDTWPEIVKQYSALGTAEHLRDAAICLIAERTFLHGQSLPRTRAEFDGRAAQQWGRLAASAREVCDVIARTLEPRARLAQRISGGTPRLWANSVADIREHASFLMPRGFLSLVPWDRFRHYPKYVTIMHERLFGLREGGSSSETAALATVAPHWKRFTGWVARAQAAQRAAADAPAPARPTNIKAPIPQTRRTAQVINLDAADWALQPGNLPQAVGEYRWALEEFRAALFGPQPPPKDAPAPTALDALWTRAQG